MSKQEIEEMFGYLFLNHSITLRKGKRTVGFTRHDRFIAVYNQKHRFGYRYTGDMDEQRKQCIRYAQQLIKRGYIVE